MLDAGGTSATITWLPPHTTLGSPVTSYTLATSPATAVSTTDAQTRSLQIFGLKADTTYAVNVYATTAAGLSSPPATAPIAAPHTWEWVHQFGSADSEFARGLTTDSSGNILVVGSTGAKLPGSPEPSAGGDDAVHHQVPS